MEFLVLLSVLAITQTTALARPADSKLKTKRSTLNDSNKIYMPTSINFPVEMESGFTVIINGTLDTKNGTLEVVFPSRDPKVNDHCTLKYDFNTSMLDVLPEHSDWKTEKYELFTNAEHPTFSIRIMAWTISDMNMFRLNFEGNSGGESSTMKCKIDKFVDVERVEFKSGIHSITSFSVYF